MSIHWFSYDPMTGAGFGKGICPDESFERLDAAKAYIQVTPEQYQSVGRADHFYVDGAGGLQPKSKLALSASALSAMAGRDITISWPGSAAVPVLVNMQPVGEHAGSVDITSAIPDSFSVELMGPRQWSEPIVVEFEHGAG